MRKQPGKPEKPVGLPYWHTFWVCCGVLWGLVGFCGGCLLGIYFLAMWDFWVVWSGGFGGLVSFWRVGIMLVFDVGFNCGLWSRDFLGRFPGSRVVGVEANVDLCGGVVGSGVILVNGLCGVVDGGVGLFNVCVGNPDISSGVPEFMGVVRHRGWYGVEFGGVVVREVPLVSLDGLVGRFGVPDVLKLDVEGGELGCLLGLSCRVGVVCFEFCEEFWGGGLLCVDRLVELGYCEFGVSFGVDRFVDGGDLVWGGRDWVVGEVVSRFDGGCWGMLYAR